MTQSANIAQAGQQNLGNYFAQGNYQALTQAQQTADAMSKMYENQTGATLNINNPSSPYNSSIYGQTNADTNPSTSYFGQTYGTQNQGMLPQNV